MPNPKQKPASGQKKSARPSDKKKAVAPRNHPPSRQLAAHRVPISAMVHHGGGHEHLKQRLLDMQKFFASNPHKVVSCPKIRQWLKEATHMLETAVKTSIGMPAYSDGVTMQFEAPPDVPTLPLEGYQLVQRFCKVDKLANSGTTAGGFYADLIASDLKNFTGNQYYRIKAVTSWTTQRGDNTGNTSFAGVSVPVQYGSSGTEVLPIWSENKTPIGKGFAGIKTMFPLGNYPLYSDADSTIICSHFTSLGGTGGIAGCPVVFMVEIEALV